jgi:alkyl hydroperoxide reductase subunit AhpC
MFPNLLDLKHEVRAAYGLPPFGGPLATFFIDSKGIIRAQKRSVFRNEEEIEDILNAVFGITFTGVSQPAQ